MLDHLHWHAAGVILAAALVCVPLTGCKIDDVKRGDEIGRFKGYVSEQKKQLQPKTVGKLSIAQCEQVALANSLDLQLRQMALKISDQNVNLALTGALPHANLGYTDTKRNNDNALTQNGKTVEINGRHEENLSLQATVPILDWGLTYYSYQIAKDQKRQDVLLLARTVQTLQRDVRTAYVRHAGALRQERSLKAALMAGQEVLRVARSLEAAGETVHADTALVQATVAQAELDLALVQRVIQDTQIQLAQLMSLPPGMQIDIYDDLPELPPLPTADDVTKYEDRALVVRPELAAQDLQRHVSAYQVRQQATAFFPRLDGIGGFNWSNNSQLTNSSWFFGGVQISHGLLNGGSDIVRYSIAKKNREIEEARSLLLSLGVVYDVDMRALNVKEMFSVMRAAESLEDARKAALQRVISLYMQGLEDQAGAARALADLTIQSTALDRAQTAYLIAWHELEFAALPEASRFDLTATTRPATQPAFPGAELLAPYMNGK